MDFLIHLNPSTLPSVHHNISLCPLSIIISFAAEVGVTSNDGPACVAAYTSGCGDGQTRLVVTRPARWLRVSGSYVK